MNREAIARKENKKTGGLFAENLYFAESTKLFFRFIYFSEKLSPYNTTPTKRIGRFPNRRK